MRRPSPDTPLYHAQFLQRLVQEAHQDCNAALQRLAAARELRCAAQPDFYYACASPDNYLVQGIPAASFHRHYGLCLQTLELTMHGYCIERRYGWERRMETVFCTAPPPWWRRAVRRAPLLALKVVCMSGATYVSVGMARPGAARPRSGHVVRLDPGMQARLASMHACAVARASPIARLLAWCRRMARRVTAPSENDI